MRSITKDISFTLDTTPVTFRLTKLDAFSGVFLLRLLLRLEQQRSTSSPASESSAPSSDTPANAPTSPAPPPPPTLLDLLSSLSQEELRSVMTSVLNHTAVLLPAGPHPVMTGADWGYPELEHDTPACLRLLLEGISWSLSGFFGEGGRTSPPAPPPSAP